MFVQFATSVGCSSGILAERLMHCITASWRDHGTHFGDALAREIDRLFTFDAPKSPQQADQQHAAKKGMAELQSLLRALDSTGDAQCTNEAMERTADRCTRRF